MQELSKRLLIVANMVDKDSVVADIGTDHAYIPIYLVEQGICTKAIAMDVNQGPLERAKEHILASGLFEHISTRLSDGLEKLTDDEADTYVIAGMGGPLMVSILRNRIDLLQAGKTLILQPQSEIYEVREFLITNQYEIIKEEMFYDMEKTYVAMKAIKCNEVLKPYTKTQYIFGKLLLENYSPVLYEFLQKQKKVYEDLIVRFGETVTKQTQIRKTECEQMLEYIGEAMKYYEM